MRKLYTMCVIGLTPYGHTFPTGMSSVGDGRLVLGKSTDKKKSNIVFKEFFFIFIKSIVSILLQYKNRNITQT